MRDRRSVLIIIALMALAFWGGMSWERGDCRLVWPASAEAMDTIMQCRNSTAFDTASRGGG